MEGSKFIERANVQLVSDGTLMGTNIFFVRENGEKERIMPVRVVDFHFDAKDKMPQMTVEILLAQVDLVVPAELVDFIRTADGNGKTDNT